MLYSATRVRIDSIADAQRDGAGDYHVRDLLIVKQASGR